MNKEEGKREYKRKARAENRAYFHFEINRKHLSVNASFDFNSTGTCTAEQAAELYKFFDQWKKKHGI